MTTYLNAQWTDDL